MRKGLVLFFIEGALEGAVWIRLMMWILLKP
jgi:hypothetical protein